MTAEYTWEMLVADHDRDVAFQEKYIYIPTFDAKVLMEKSEPVLRKAWEVARKETPQPGMRTTISQMEIVYPFLLQKIGLISSDIPEWAVGETVNKGSIIGTELHKADAIFSMVVQGIKGHNLLRSYLPSYSDEEMDAIAYAVGDVDVNKEMTRQGLIDSLVVAWSRYRNLILPKKYKDTPLPGLGIVDPREEDMFSQSLEVGEKVIVLAEAWARELLDPNPLTWEFVRRSDTQIVTQREVLAAIKFIGPNLQFIIRFDSLSRMRRKSDKVKSQQIDLKTGAQKVTSPLDAEIKKRQAQIMRVAAEKFTVKYMTKFRNLIPRDNAFVMRTFHDKEKGSERVDLSAYRYIDLETGQMHIEPVTFLKEKNEHGEEVKRGREEFNSWLVWYGTLMHHFRSEIRELLRRSPNYKLSKVDVSDEDLKKFTGKN